MSDFLKKFMDLTKRNAKLNKLIEDCKEKLIANPRSIELLSQLTEAYNLIGLYEKVIALCREILKINQNYIPALNNIFYAFDRLEKFDQALNVLKTYIEIYPLHKNKEVEHLSFSQTLQNYFEKSRNEPLLELYLPSNYPSVIIDINFSTAFHCSKIGWSKRSHNVLKLVLDKYPEDVDLLNAFGFSYFSLEKYNDAKNAFDKALEIDEKNVMTHYLLGSFYLKIRSYAKAEIEFESVINQSQIWADNNFPLITSESPEGDYQNLRLIRRVTIKLGSLYNKIGEYEKTIYTCNKALALTNQFSSPFGSFFSKYSKSGVLALVYENLGVAYYALDNSKMAIKAFKKALKSNPENIDVLEYLGEVYVDMKKSKLALEIFKNIVRIKPDEAQAWHMLAISYSQNRKFSHAKEANNRCLALNPDYKPALELHDKLS